MNKPKYEIGQEVFFLYDNKLKQDTVKGIFMRHEEKRTIFDETSKKFLGFIYNFEISYSPSEYDWKKEEEIFKTKDSLIASLI